MIRAAGRAGSTRDTFDVTVVGGGSAGSLGGGRLASETDAHIRLFQADGSADGQVRSLAGSLNARRWSGLRPGGIPGWRAGGEA